MVKGEASSLCFLLVLSSLVVQFNGTVQYGGHAVL